METKQCRYCYTNKSVDDFEIANVIKGVEYRRHKCSRCYQDDKILWRGKNRIWLDELKKSLHCIKCGETDFRVLDFHHRDRSDKELEVASALGRWGQKRILEEIAKCDILCAKCHRILHWEERHSECNSA